MPGDINDNHMMYDSPPPTPPEPGKIKILKTRKNPL